MEEDAQRKPESSAFYGFFVSLAHWKQVSVRKEKQQTKGLLAYARDPGFGLLQKCNSQRDYAPFGRMILCFVRC
ncbi:hypothetical protein [Gilvibacter sp.]|uniref:hypothetical protein n=1 Tax=Gilvibacter sp. TaxID=2729997 RepID=UPI003B529EBA